MRKLYECESKFEREKQRDLMLDEVFEKICNIEKVLSRENATVTDMREQVTDIQKRVKDIEQKLVYVGATPEERKYINVDGTIKYDAINETCEHILDLFGDEFIDKEGVSKDEINS